MGLAAIQIDTFEPEWAQQLPFGGVPTAVVPLDAGDYLCACTTGDLIAIERKTSDDLLNTLKEDRLFPQMTKLRQVTSWAYLVITGSLVPGPQGKCITDRGVTGWNWASVSGALLTIQELGIGILHVASDVDFEQAVIRLANRERQDLRVQSARNATFVSDQDALLSALPGVGPERATKILEYCGSAAAGLCWLTDTEPTSKEHIPGIGEQTRRKIRQALGLDNGLKIVLTT